MISLFLAGDVMTGRGIDQILSHPSEPQLYESYVKDARDYVILAEEVNGTILRRVSGDYLWGDGLLELKARKPDIKIINLETSITKNNHPWPYKGINYRMHPDNIDAIQSAKIDVCALANNHVLDWDVPGLMETLASLDKANIQHAGAGKDIFQATKPAILSVPVFSGRVLIFSMGTPTSGIPSNWGALQKQPGVWLLPDLSSNTIQYVKQIIETFRKPGDLCIISIHWGENWGYDMPVSYQQFAHQLITEAGVNVIHGHSSHHPKGIEIYHHSPILYGCGDLINDYEGIAGYESFHTELTLMYFLVFDEQLRLTQLELVPFERKNFSLHYAKAADGEVLTKILQSISVLFNTTFEFTGNMIRVG